MFKFLRTVAAILLIGASTGRLAAAEATSCGSEYEFQFPAFGYPPTYVIYREPYFYGISGRFFLASLDGVHWRQAAEVTADKLLKDLCWGRRKFVAVGTHGTIATSANGSEWNVQSVGEQTDLWSVAAGPEGFVTVGTYQDLYFSADGDQWTSVEIQRDWSLHAVAWGKGAFVAVGSGGTILSSTDGQHWEARSSAAEDEWQGITFDGSQFIVAGRRGSIETSADGIAWTQRYQGDQSFYGIGSSDSMAVAVGSDGAIVVSHDCIEWEDRTTGRSGYLRDVAYGNGLYLIGGDQELLASGDGLAWTPVAARVTWRGIAFGTDRIVLAGSNALGVKVNGSTWTYAFPGGQPDHMRGACIGAGTFVAVGDQDTGGIVMTSPDGFAWTRRDNTAMPPLNAVTYGGGRFVAVGKAESIFASADGTTWEQVYSGDADALKFVVYGAGLFLAGGEKGALYSSTDGIVWTNIPLPDSYGYDLKCAAYGGGAYLIGGSGYWLSWDGAGWTRILCECPRDSFVSMTYDGARFFGMTFDGWVYSSGDGLNWQLVYTVPWGLDPQALAYGGGEYLMVGTRLIGESFCRLDASISAGPRSGAAPQDVQMEAVVRGGMPPYSCSWQFGDGSDGHGESVSHRYSGPGSYTIQLVVVDAALDRYDARPVLVGLPATRPTISGVRKQTGPLRLKVSGAGFHPNCVIKISESKVPVTVRKSPESLMAKGGAGLKALLPKGVQVQITVINTDDGGESVPFTFVP